MTISEDIQKSINEAETRLAGLQPALHEANNNQTCFNSQMCISKRAQFQDIHNRVNAVNDQLSKLRAALTSQIEKELTEIKIETKLDIPQNTLNQLGESIEPITTQLKKPENQGLLLIAGLVAAAIIIN